MTELKGIEKTLDWFQKAVPEPTSKNIHTQLGVHFEEVVEMLETLKGTTDASKALLLRSVSALHALANHLKETDNSILVNDRVEMLDGLLDQIVTAVGVAHMLNMNVCAGLIEVNDSNYSKFVNGKAIFDENGKIIKGTNYFKPVLAKFV